VEIRLVGDLTRRFSWDWGDCIESSSATVVFPLPRARLWNWITTHVPGFLDATRYVAEKGGPKYLAVYELASADALKTAEF